MIKELREEIDNMSASIKKWKKQGHPEEAKALKEMQDKLKARLKLYTQSMLSITCKECNHTDMAHEFEIRASVEECEHCGNHVQITGVCPKCKYESVMYQDPQYG